MQDLSRDGNLAKADIQGPPSRAPLRIPKLSGGRHLRLPPVPAVPLPAESGTGVGCGRGPQAVWRTRDKEPGMCSCAGNASSDRQGPALSIGHAAKPTRSISWTEERAQAGHSPEEHAGAEVGVLQRVGFHLGVHRQHLARGARGRAAARGSAD